MEQNLYKNYISLLKAELLPALGCTEPIAIAFCAAKARAALGCIPDYMEVTCSGDIIKNVKGVTVPNSGGMKGIEAAAVLGMYGGNADLELEVLSTVTDNDCSLTKAYVEEKKCKVSLLEGEENLYILTTMIAGKDSVSVEVKYAHNNITRIVKNGEVLYEEKRHISKHASDKSFLNVKDIYEFANIVKIEDIREVIERQIKMNTKIAEEGINHSWGMNIGRANLKYSGAAIKFKAAAMAAAGSDARMSGCALPVVINSGSGNQGITITLPIVVYAQEWNVSHDKMLRALVLANLLSMHQKRFIGSLSAYCGAVNAATGAACGIAYMREEALQVIENTIINSVATIGGMVCDGAKPSCAAKIRSAVDTALLAYELASEGHVYRDGEGIVGKDIETTIQNVGRMGKIGMAGTDIEILNIMIEN